MKRLGSALLLFFFFASLLCFPGLSISGASAGILLWFQKVLPVLLPFILASRLMAASRLMDRPPPHLRDGHGISVWLPHGSGLGLLPGGKRADYQARWPADAALLQSAHPHVPHRLYWHPVPGAPAGPAPFAVRLSAFPGRSLPSYRWGRCPGRFSWASAR